MGKIDQIIKLIQEEAKERPGGRDFVSKLYNVQLEVGQRIGGILKAIRDKEYEDHNKKGG